MSSETTAMAAPASRLGEPLPHDLLDDGERLTRKQLRELQLDRLGPGATPVAASFSVALDPRVVSDVRIVGARLNGKVHDAGVRLLTDTRTVALSETRWTTRVKLKAGDRLDLALEVKTRKPTGDVPASNTRRVGLIDIGDQIAQRQTGRTSMSRSDSAWA